MSAEPDISWGRVASLALVPIVVLALIGGVMAYHQVPEGHAGVEKEWGAVTGTIDSPGATFKIPVAQSIQNVETRPRTYTMAQDIGEGNKKEADAVAVKTVNGSTVKVDITVRYRIDPERADQFVSEWNNEKQMEQRLIRPTIRTQLRDEASSLQTTGPGSIYTQEGRAALERTAIEALRDEFEGQPIILEAVQIRNIDLPDEIDETLDEKEQAKQQVEVEKQKVKQEEAKAEQKRIQAEADADVIRIKGEALRENEIVLKDRYIDALRNGETIYVVPDDGGAPVLLEASSQGNSTVTNADD
ncbi:lipoprotein [Haloarcula hispanica tailed virus 2]|uniref:Band 7 domain-containing protein n=1 Tax=Haloarcula hispanica tailed virus 2 TaxID=1273751 RepID=R4T8M4_9CAUD|nr:lipoprotein [Haloarcula hispanica tailed virus 2]AGM11245.1 hypothetical protein HHTV2_81 [Haloarcula hispanica tailed virus 2]